MKKFKPVVSLMAVFFAFCLTAACTGGPSPAKGANHAGFELRKFSSSVLLFPEQINESPRMNFNLSILEPSGPKDREHFFRALLYDGERTDEYKDTLIEKYRAAWQDMREVMEKTPGMSSAVMNWEYTEHMDIKTFADYGVIIGRKKEYYTGGAHGMSEKEYYVVDLREPRALTWRGLFINPDDPDLYGIVLDALREHAGLKKNAPLSSGIYFDDSPEMSDNFFLAPDGLGFRWNPYAIGPYSAGAIEIVIPWKKIRYFLNDEGLAVLNQWFHI
jgi:hypothetical protein